jgi:hypothetical protein
MCMTAINIWKHVNQEFNDKYLVINKYSYIIVYKFGQTLHIYIYSLIKIKFETCVRHLHLSHSATASSSWNWNGIYTYVKSRFCN